MMVDLLVVDDEKWIRKGVIAKLNKSHLNFGNIYEASDGSEAIKVIEENNPNIVITDIIMPKLDGLELIEYANKLEFDISFIIISGYSEFSYAQRAINLGAKGYILKPITQEKLVSIVEKVIQDERDAEIREHKNYELDMVTKVKRYIIDNYSENITVKGIAEHFSINPNYLSSLFSKETGETITKFINRMRIEEACKILRRSDEPIYNIAFKVGYKDNQYFHRVFKKLKGKIPLDYRNQYKIDVITK